MLWAYDADEVARRISLGLLISAIAETADGELLCHSGLSLATPDDVVGHAGQALTLPAARGRHIFTAVKRIRRVGDVAGAGGHVQRSHRLPSL